MSELMVGIDGGGTKTDMVLFTLSGNVLARVIAPGCNPNDFGWQHAEDVLAQALDLLLQKHGGRNAALQSVFAGVSGGTVGNNRELMAALLRRLLPAAKHIANDSDAVSALSSGIGHADGCVLISGTGSVGYGRTGERIFRAGGWGYLFDRGGSGYDFGRDAVYAALCAYDGRGPQTALSGMIEEQLGAPIQYAVTDLYLRGKPSVAALAPLVFRAAEQGDPVANRILDDNIAELATLCNTLAQTIPGKTCRTVLVGSIFRDWKQIEPRLVPQLVKQHSFVFPALAPVFGSAIEAAALRAAPVQETFEETFARGLQECPVQRLKERQAV